MVVEFPTDITQGCKICRKVLKKGKYVIGIYVRENGSDYKYLLGAPPQEHCGEQKIFLQCFEAEAEAEVEGHNVLSYISEKGTTEGLSLMEFVDPRSN